MNDAVVLQSAHGRALVHPLGATVLSWIPEGGTDVLFVASGARFEEGHAIRGGVPVCWPWFADAGTPAHGLVRKRRWTVLGQQHHDGVASVELGVDHDDDDWSFSLTYRVTLDRDLTLELVHVDRSGAPRLVTGALHTYLRLDPGRARVHGLDAVAWDKLASGERRVDGSVSLQGPLDLVVPHDGPVTVEHGDGRLQIEGHHHGDVVLWNPGGAPVSDLAPGEEAEFACVETAIVTNPVEVPAEGRLTFGVRFRAG